jgi:hypothetical protein
MHAVAYVDRAIISAIGLNTRNELISQLIAGRYRLVISDRDILLKRIHGVRRQRTRDVIPRWSQANEELHTMIRSR